MSITFKKKFLRNEFKILEDNTKCKHMVDNICSCYSSKCFLKRCNNEDNECDYLELNEEKFE